MVVAHVQVAQHLERVVDGLHPRRKFFLERTREEAQFLAHRNGRARDHEPAEFAVQHRALQSRRHRQQCFSRAGLAHEGDEFHAVVEQRVEGVMLLAVARLDAPDAFPRVNDGDEFRPGRVHLRQRGLLGVRLVYERAELVGKIFFAAVQFQFAVGAEGGEFFRRHRHLHHAGVEVGDEHAVGLVILRRKADGVGLDAQVDVFADEDGRVFRLRLLGGRREGQDPVVHRVVGKNRLAGAVFVEADLQGAAVRQLHALAQAAVATVAVEHPRNGARIAAQLGGLALEPVNLLDHLDGDEDVVVRKVEDGVRVVEEDVGVEDVVLHVIKRRQGIRAAGAATTSLGSFETSKKFRQTFTDVLRAARRCQ